MWQEDDAMTVYVPEGNLPVHVGVCVLMRLQMGKQPSIPTGEECNRVVTEKEAGPTTQTRHPGFRYIFLV